MPAKCLMASREIPDSFTYNVVQYLGELGAEVKVVRNDELTVAEIEALNPERIVVSPLWLRKLGSPLLSKAASIAASPSRALLNTCSAKSAASSGVIWRLWSAGLLSDM